MSEQKYELHRGLFVTLGVLLIGVAMFRSCMPSTPTATSAGQTSIQTPEATQTATLPTATSQSRKPKPEPQTPVELQDPVPSAAPPPKRVPLQCLDPEFTGNFEIQACECRHDNPPFIQCVWFMKNITNREPIKLWAQEVHVTDNESRENFVFNSNWSADSTGFGFCNNNGNVASLMYNDWTRFCFRYKDSNPDLKTINTRLDFRFDNSFDHFFYEARGVPVRP